MNVYLIIGVSILFIGWVFNLGLECPCPSTRKNEGCMRYEILGIQPSHFIFFIIMGFFFSNYFYTFLILGILWEIFEYYLHKDSKFLKKLGGCLELPGKTKPKTRGLGFGEIIYANRMKKYNAIDRFFGIKNSTKHGWHHSVAEVLLNIAGFYVGSYLHNHNYQTNYVIALCLLVMII
jgi:hypothetical protein